MHAFIQSLYGFILALGVFGPLVLGVIDAILVIPLAQDVLVVALASQHQNTWWLYALMATAGSIIGCFILDVLGRRGGEAGLKKLASQKRVDYIKEKVEKGAGKLLAVAAIMPPPFPFKPAVAGAAALQYPRSKLLSIVAVVRGIRFFGLALLAQFYGKQILRLAEFTGRLVLHARVDRDLGGRQRILHLPDREEEP